MTTRLKGRPPILSCAAADQPTYPASRMLLDGDGSVLGWIRPWPRKAHLWMVIACRSGMMRHVAMTMDGINEARATAFLVAFHETQNAIAPVGDW